MYNMTYVKFLFILVLALTVYVCEARDARCLLPIESGICFGNMERYGFDVSTEQCRQFIYGGCQGNDNRFDSLDECRAAC